ncbi:MAG: hypothetical protein ACI80V_003594 [Rhodothermales bacterium]|jgi:hypothetical protein
MSKILSRAGWLACGVLLLSGCDAVDTAINDALPEVGVADGVLGLGGEAGTEVTSSFAAGKSGGIDAVATFTVSDTFNDLDSGDIQTISNLSTTVGLNVLNGTLVGLTRTSGSTPLPNTITITAARVSWTLSDASASVADDKSTALSLTLTRLGTCAAEATSCGYAAASIFEVFPLATFAPSNTAATSIFNIVKQSTPATPNSVNLSVVLTVTNTAAEFSGMAATVRIGESETTLQPAF